MENYTKCKNGHFYNFITESTCPYCHSEEYHKIKDHTTFTPISLNASDLYKEVNIIFQLDTAPDQVKRFIRINRQYGDLRMKQFVARNIDCKESDLPNDINMKISELENLINSELLKKNIIKINGEGELIKGDYFLSEKNITSIVPDTLMTQILGSQSKLALLYPEPEYAFANKDLATGASAFSNEDFQIERINIESKKHIAISLEDNNVKVLRLKDTESYSTPLSVEAFLGEDISIFNPLFLIQRFGETIVEECYNPDTFITHLTHVANDSSLSLFFRISRKQIASVFTTMFYQIAELHKTGLIHGDLKPQNIFCFKDRITAFDHINVPVGKVSAGMTTNYCAPEQILNLPVTASTDIYNLGLILLSVVDGVLYGKTSNYTIPTGGTEVKNVKLLTEPLIYIDYVSSNIEDKSGIPFWKSFLEKCLAFDQKNRFQDMESFISEYIRLIELYPLKNNIEFRPNFGELSLAEINGQFEAAWFV